MPPHPAIPQPRPGPEHTVPRRAVVLVALGTVLGPSACNPIPDPGGQSETGSSTRGDDPDSTSSTTMISITTTSATTSSTDGAESSSTDTGILVDMGAPDMPGVEPGPCGAVDILFVIDNSLSMSEHQAQLATPWPAFVGDMWAALPEGTSVHVGLTTTSFFDGPCSESVFDCVTQASDAEILAHYITPDMGSTGVNGAQGRLLEWDGQRYFEATVGEDSSDLEQWFSGAVMAGEAGCSFEMMSAGAGYALHPANAGFNAGFLRDEGSVLVIVVLTDEPDKSPEGPQTYRDMILDAKAGCGGDPCVIVTGLINPCIEGVDNELWQFFGLFSNFLPPGNIDVPGDYAQVLGPTLAQAMGDACEQISPAG